MLGKVGPELVLEVPLLGGKTGSVDRIRLEFPWGRRIIAFD